MLLPRSVMQSVDGWRTNPIRMVAQLITSFIIGQGIFWHFGYDQLGIGMDPKKQFGAGIKIAEKVADKLPGTARAAWVIKFVEILCDLGKMPLEGRAFAKHGIVPDVVAAAVTQPTWSGIEAAEKTLGVIMHPERVNTPEQIKLSLGCIYGSVFRYVLGSIVIVVGGHINRLLTNPIEQLLRLLLKRG